MSAVPEPTDGEAVETPDVDPISQEALAILITGMQERTSHVAWHVDRREYRTIMAHLRDLAGSLNVAYKLAEALLEQQAKAN